MQKEHFDYIDFAKGIGILLVIMGHSLFPLHFAIDVFHMPLFFTLAGITYNTPTNKSEFLLKKIDRIFIPWIFFTMISTLASYIVPTIREGAPFNGPLWFLQTIFTAILLYMIMDIYLKKSILSIIIILFSIYTFILAKYSLICFPFHTDRALCAMVFIHLGRLVKSSFSTPFVLKYVKSGGVILIALYIVATYFLVSKYDVSGALFMNGKTYSHNYFLFYIASISAILSVIIISYSIKKISIINYLGKNSLIILCVHFPFIEGLNVLISKTSLYTDMGIGGKILAGLIVYTLILVISMIFIIICQHYLPTLTGYKNYFFIKKTEQ